MPTNAGAVAFVCHGWLTPAAPGCTTFVRCEMRDSQRGVAHPTKSGGRQPAVVIGIAVATALPLTHGRPPTVCVRIAVAVAFMGATGLT
jgi:hypothetical protein